MTDVNLAFKGVANVNADIHRRASLAAIFVDEAGKIHRKPVSILTPEQKLQRCDKWGEPLTPDSPQQYP